jgi:hypothetical protein
MTGLVVFGFFLILGIVGYTIWAKQEVDAEMDRINKQKTFGDF